MTFEDHVRAALDELPPHIAVRMQVDVRDSEWAKALTPSQKNERRKMEKSTRRATTTGIPSRRPTSAAGTCACAVWAWRRSA